VKESGSRVLWLLVELEVHDSLRKLSTQPAPTVSRRNAGQMWCRQWPACLGHPVQGMENSTTKPGYLSECGRRVATQELCRRGHLLLADQEALVVALATAAHRGLGAKGHSTAPESQQEKGDHARNCGAGVHPAPSPHPCEPHAPGNPAMEACPSTKTAACRPVTPGRPFCSPCAPGAHARSRSAPCPCQDTQAELRKLAWHGPSVADAARAWPSPKDVGPLVVLNVRAAHRIPPPRRCDSGQGGKSGEARMDSIQRRSWAPPRVQEPLTQQQVGGPLGMDRRTQPQVAQEQLLFMWRVWRAQQEVLRLHVTMDIPTEHPHSRITHQCVKTSSDSHFQLSTRSKLTCAKRPDSPLRVQLFQDCKRLHCYAGHHLLRHDLTLRIPDVP
jgi:hypothetical protein